MSRLILFGLLSVACGVGHASEHTLEEELATVRRMLECVASTVVDVLPSRVSVPDWSSQSVFFRLKQDGWTEADNRMAFDHYIKFLSTNDCATAGSPDYGCCEEAVTQCRFMNYTNAVPDLRRLILNTKHPRRKWMIYDTLAICPVDDWTTDCVEAIMTNLTEYTCSERFTAVGVYAKKLRSVDAVELTSEDSYGRAIGMYYRNRNLSSAAAVSIDMLLAEKLSGYSMSSNRLETINHILEGDGITQRERRHFDSITNTLLSAGQSLPWIDIR